jgi:Domain of unknown function (DUF4148)
MNTKSIIVAAFAAATTFASFGAMAQEVTPDAVITGKSAVTRQSVHQEAVAAVAAGRVHFGEVSRSFDAPSAGKLTRAEVAAEARAAVRQGKVHTSEA